MRLSLWLRRSFALGPKVSGKMVEPAGATDALYARYANVFQNAVQGQVVTRFPPEPSGFLHIGHVKAVMLNYHYAKIYGGRMLLRFDDTNPAKESEDFVQNIKEDLVRLGIVADAESNTSDHFAHIEQEMARMLAQGDAYLDNTPVDEMRRQRNEGIESLARSQTVEENLALWREFRQGHKPDYCVRGKIDMQCKNKCMRDPVFYRYSDIQHHRTGSQFLVYPTYDFACPLVDVLEGVTHTLRTSEYNDRNDMYYWVLRKLGLREPKIFDYSRLSFVYTVLSKRKLQKLVSTGVVEGWNDPRFPTVQGVLRRGMLVQTLRDFMLDQGPSKSTVLMEWDKIWATNKQLIDPIAPRITSVSNESLCLMELVNGPEAPEQRTQPLHPKNEALGHKEVIYYKSVLLEHSDARELRVGEKITLMKWGNALIEAIDAAPSDTYKGVPFTTKLTARLDLDDKDFKSTKKLTWLPNLPDALAHLQLVEYSNLITSRKVEEDDDFDSLINRNSKFVTEAIGELHAKGLKENDIIQLERRGYFRVDRAGDAGTPWVLINIPDGKTKTMSGLDAKVDPGSIIKGEEQGLSKRQQARKEKKEKGAKKAGAAEPSS